MSEELRGTRVIVECCGSMFYAERSEKGYLICPICRQAIFFSARDLLRHLVAHAEGTLQYKHRVPRR